MKSTLSEEIVQLDKKLSQETLTSKQLQRDRVRESCEDSQRQKLLIFNPYISIVYSFFDTHTMKSTKDDRNAIKILWKQILIKAS